MTYRCDPSGAPGKDGVTVIYSIPGPSCSARLAAAAPPRPATPHLGHLLAAPHPSNDQISTIAYVHLTSTGLTSTGPKSVPGPRVLAAAEAHRSNMLQGVSVEMG